MAHEWIFDRAPDSGAKKGGLANAHVFPPDLDYFVREVLQNSKDQGLDGGRVDVRFTLREISGPDLELFKATVGWAQLEQHLDATAVPQLVTIGPRLRSGLDRVQAGRLRLLCIEDSNTRGLEGGEDDDENFASLVRHELITGAGRKESGGSFGLGKSVLWRFSDLSTVLFHSLVANERRNRLIGRTVLAAHEAEGERWEGSGWFGQRDTKARRAVSVWDDDARQLAEPLGLSRPEAATGASILILGFDDPGEPDEPGIEKTCEKILSSATRWFWPALLRGEMSVLVEGYEDDDPVFARHAQATNTEVAPFVHAEQDVPVPEDTIEEPGEVTIRELTITVPRQRPEIFGEDARSQTVANATLRVRLAESGDNEFRNTVALQRGTGMVVQYRPVRARSGSDQGFHAVLLAGRAHGGSDADRALEEFLRAAEPPAHEEWTYTTERIKAGFFPGYRKALEDLFTAIDQAVRDLTREETIESDEAPDTLKKLFPLPGIGEPLRAETYRLLRPRGELLDDRWQFEATYVRKPVDEEERKRDWQFRIALGVDQEGTGTLASVPVADLTVDSPATAAGVADDGTVTVRVPAATTEVSFRGTSNAVDQLPPGGLRRVRLRMDLKGSVSKEAAK